MTDVRDVMIQGESGLIESSHPGEVPVWEPSKRRVTWPNGAYALCIAEGVGHWKPARQIFEHAAARCGESLEGAWMIGDNPVADIGGARACGARTVWIQTGAWPTELDYEPDHSVDSFSDAVRLVLS